MAQKLYADPSGVDPFQSSQPKTTKNKQSIGFKDIANRLEKKGRKTSQIKLRFKTVRDDTVQQKSQSTIGVQCRSQPKISGKILKLGTASKSALQKACEFRKASCVSQG